MRISDWSSDVCSSDLAGRRRSRPGGARTRPRSVAARRPSWLNEPRRDALLRRRIGRFAAVGHGVLDVMCAFARGMAGLFGGITRGVADLPARVTSCVPNRPRRVARRMADVLGGVARGVTDLASRLLEILNGRGRRIVQRKSWRGGTADQAQRKQ